MQNKNKEENENKENTKKSISYDIKTMESDLKKEGSKRSSFEFSVGNPVEKQEPERKKEPITPEEKPEEKVNFNPFLSDLKPDPSNPLSNPNYDKKSKQSHPSAQNNHEKENSLQQTPDKKMDSQNHSKEKIPSPPKKDNPSSSLNDKFKKPIVKTDISPINNSNKKILEKEAPKKNSLNSILLISLVLILFISIGSGVYYFYFFNQADPVSETPFSNNPIETPSNYAEKQIPEKLKDSKLISINSNENFSLVSELKKEKETLPMLGQYYKINENSNIISSGKALALLNIQLSEVLLNELNNSWVYLKKNPENILKMGLIFEIKDSEKTREFLLNNEPTLPQSLKPMFIDEVFVLQDDEIIFQDSQELPDVRYYNLVEGFDEKAIDWKILENKYLLLATSKETMRNLISDLSNTASNFNSEETSLEIESQEKYE